MIGQPVVDEVQCIIRWLDQLVDLVLSQVLTVPDVRGIGDCRGVRDPE